MHRMGRLGVLLVSLCWLAGCGATKSQLATEQLLLSDAVDRAISTVDFRPLSGRTVYLDTTYLRAVKGVGFVNSDYIISSLRQQLFAADCHLQESMEAAEYVVEARVGALGSNAHEITYGVPANNLLAAATALVPNAPVVPTIPELALAKRNDNAGAAKLGLFAYHRESREPIWQSGIAQSRSTAKNFWLFGAGPFQRGTIYGKTRFAGQEIKIPLLSESGEGRRVAAPVDYFTELNFEQRRRLAEVDRQEKKPPAPVRQAGHQQPAASASISDQSPSPAAGTADAMDDEPAAPAASPEPAVIPESSGDPPAPLPVNDSAQQVPSPATIPLLRSQAGG